MIFILRILISLYLMQVDYIIVILFYIHLIFIMRLFTYANDQIYERIVSFLLNYLFLRTFLIFSYIHFLPFIYLIKYSIIQSKLEVKSLLFSMEEVVNQLIVIEFCQKQHAYILKLVSIFKMIWQIFFNILMDLSCLKISILKYYKQ